MLTAFAPRLHGYDIPGPLQVETEFYFSHLNTANSDLSFNCVNCLCEDSLGYIWAGTSDGLNCYDGTRIRSFHKEELGLSSSFIVSLHFHDGRLWIGTDNGVTYYDYRTGRFIPFRLTSPQGTAVSGKATVITSDPGGNIWIAVNEHGLFRYTPGTGRLVSYFGGERRLPANIRCMAFDRDGNALLSLYYNNLYHVDWKRGSITPVKLNGDPRYFAKDNVVAITIANDTTIYAVSSNRGLVQLSPGGAAHVLTPQIPIHDPQGCFVTDADVWIPAINGLYRYNRSDGECAVLDNDPDLSSSISDSFVMSVMLDSRGGLWCGTASAGLDYTEVSTRRFKRTVLKVHDSRRNAKVHSIDIDRHGSVWCATAHGGLIKVERTGKASRFMPEIVPSETFDVQFAGDEMWVVAINGIYRINPDTGRHTFYDRLADEGNLREAKFVRVRTCSSGDIYILTTLGLYRYDHDTDMFIQLPGLNECYITDLAEDDYGHLWLSTFAHGLICYDPARHRILSHRRHICDNTASLPTDKLLSVMVDNDGTVWACTFGAGIVRFDTDSTFTVFDRRIFGDRVAADVAYQLFQDKTGRMWATTCTGLLCFDPAGTRAVSFRRRHGLLNEDFEFTHGTITRDGSLYLCSSEGFVSFRPQLFGRRPDNSRLVLTALRINGTTVSAGVVGSPLTRAIDLTDEISVSHDSDNIEIDFSHINFADEDASPISYRLAGSDDRWHPVPTDGTLVFAGLAPGKYTLEFRRECIDGTTAADVHPPLRIRMTGPFYNNGWAWLVYALLTICAVSISYRISNRRRIRLAQERERQITRQHEIEGYNEKVAMISSLVNKIRTPLALIRNPLANIMRGDIDTDMAEDIMVVRDGADKLSAVIAEFVGSTADTEDISEESTHPDNIPEICPQTMTAPETVDDGKPEAAHLIMLIEPVADMFADIKGALKSRYRVLVVRSADFALELLHKKPADLLIIPGKSKGKTAADISRAIAADGALADIPIIAILASGDTEGAVEAMQGGAAQVIAVPCPTDYVMACIDSVLRRSLNREQHRTSSLMVLNGGSILQLSEEDADFLRRLDAIVMENIGEADFSNEQLARMLCMSKSTLMRRMKSVLSTTPKDYILNKRLVMAAEMLRQSNCRVNEVCYAVGFNTPSYFAKSFKRAYGVLPSEYRSTDEPPQ